MVQADPISVRVRVALDPISVRIRVAVELAGRRTNRRRAHRRGRRLIRPPGRGCQPSTRGRRLIRPPGCGRQPSTRGRRLIRPPGHGRQPSTRGRRLIHPPGRRHQPSTRQPMSPPPRRGRPRLRRQRRGRWPIQRPARRPGGLWSKIELAASSMTMTTKRLTFRMSYRQSVIGT